MIVIHLNFKTKEDDKKKKKATKKKEGEAGPQESDGESNTINFFPNLEKVESFFNNALKMIVDSTNKVSNLEDDLMPFLKKDKLPNFAITEEFPWVIEAKERIQKMFDDNKVGPLQLLDTYKQFEYILNVDRKQLVKDLFGETKAPLKEIKQKIQEYENAYNQIQNLSNDVVDFPLFRVMAGKMKEQLSHQAAKIKEKLLENVYNYCKKTVDKIFNGYDNMNKTIMTEPTNERELVATRDFIKDTPNKVEQLSQELNEVYRHYCMLDDFSYKYADSDIETFWI